MLDQMWPTGVVKARGKPLRQLDRMIRRSQKQRAGIPADRPAVECHHDVAAFNDCKSEQVATRHSIGIGALRELPAGIFRCR